jgi:hypothetical protein|tara:strand:+ start:264 stop:446 length:183 start_codon:yes stop_codon:yes gene_type:complete
MNKADRKMQKTLGENDADIEFNEFIPYKEALRIKNTIQFSLRVDGRDPQLKMGGWDNITK